MSYLKTIWIEGDEISSDRLNKLEAGLEAAALAADKAQLEILPEQTFTGWKASASGSLYSLFAKDTRGVTPTPGESYAVLWNDKEYICECYDELTGGGISFTNARIFGNGGLLGDTATVKTDDPFFMFEAFGEWYMWTTEPGDSHKVGIKLARAVNVEQIKASAEDEGKILSVVDGKPVWVAMAQAEDASF